MDRLQKLGANIRGLRKAFGETQKTLGDAIGAAKNTISQYESGKNDPKENLLVIAERYGVTVEQLYTGDYTHLKKMNINPKIMGERLNEVIPVFSSPEAMTDNHFRNAYKIHGRFLECLNNPDEVVFNATSLETCIEEYGNAIESDRPIYEAIANCLGLLVRLSFPIKMIPAIIDKKTAVMEVAKKQSPELREEIDNPNSSFRKDMLALMDDVGDWDVDEDILELVKLLKENEVWSNLADYYLAIRYIFNIVDSGFGYEYNNMIGMEMLSSFALVGNPYAKQFIRLSLESVGA